MATTLTEQDGDKVLEVAASGKLTHRDYEQFVPTFERLVKQHGKIRVLFPHDRLPRLGSRGPLGRHQVRSEALCRRRATGHGRRQPVGEGDERVLSPVHHRHDPLF